MNKFLNDVLFDVLTSRLFENEYFLNQDELDNVLKHKNGDEIEEIIGELQDLASVVSDVKAQEDVQNINNEDEEFQSEVEAPEEVPQEEDVESSIPPNQEVVEDLNQQPEEQEEPQYNLNIQNDQEEFSPDEFDENEEYQMEEVPEEVEELNQEAPQEQIPLQPEQPQQVDVQPQNITIDELKAAAKVLNLVDTNSQPTQPVQQTSISPIPEEEPPVAPENTVAGPPQVSQVPQQMQPEQMIQPQVPSSQDPNINQISDDENIGAEQIPMEEEDPSTMSADPNMMGQDPMMGGMMGMDPMMGMEPESPSPEDIGKGYILKKIHGKLLDIDKLLINYTQKEYIKFKEDFKEGIELFDIIIDNFEQFKDKIDIVVAQFERFLLVAAKQLYDINKKVNEKEKLEEERTEETLGIDNSY